jgi:hypothetical protein
MPRTVKLTAPPGYGKLVPLDRQQHAGMGLAADPGYGWCSELNAAFVNAAEFFKVALDYPIAFVREPHSGEFVPMAVFGLKAKQNLFVGADGRWRPHTYIPAYCRRHPFCIAEIPAGKGETPQRMICVEAEALSRASPRPLFDAQGRPTAAWTPIQKLLEALEGARQQTRVLTRRLEALNLLVPFDAVAMPRTGERSRLQGLYRVDEARLADVPTKHLKTMTAKHELRAIYAHLLSLENFGRLLDYAQAPSGRA